MGQTVERDIKGGEIHSCDITISAGYFVKLQLDQRGIDIEMELMAPGKPDVVARVNNADGTFGNEILFGVAEMAGDYRLTVRPKEKNPEAGRYEIRIEELREAKDIDRQRVKAQGYLSDGRKLREDGDEKSLREAVAKDSVALDIWRVVAEPRAIAETLSELGRAYYELDEYPEAQEVIGRSIELYKKLGDRRGEADALGNMGLMLDSMGEKQQAEEFHQQALPLAREGNDLRILADVLNNYGLHHQSLGEYNEALDNLKESLTLSKRLDKRNDTAITLDNLGALSRQLGRRAEALDFYQDAKGYSNDKALEARMFNGKGMVYYSDFLAGGQTAESGISDAWHKKPQLEKALESFQSALVLLETDGSEQQLQAVVLTNLGVVEHSRGEQEQALAHLNRALEIRKAKNDRRGEAYTRSVIGLVYNAVGKSQQGQDELRKALRLSKAVGDRPQQASILAELARAKSDRGRLNQALLLIEQSVGILESLRARLSNQVLQMEYFGSQQRVYAFYIDLLMKLHKLKPSAGYEKTAFQVSERARARALLETLQAARVELSREAPTDLRERQKQIRRSIFISMSKQLKMLSGVHTAAQAAGIERQIAKLNDDYDAVEQEIGKESRGYQSLVHPDPIDIARFQQQLDADTIVLDYLPGEKYLYLCAITQTTFDCYGLEANREQIEKAAKDVYTLVTAPVRLLYESDSQFKSRVTGADLKYPAEASKLSWILLGPVSSRLGQKRLLIIADGEQLSQTPFAALPSLQLDERQHRDIEWNDFEPLVVKHEIVRLPSATTLIALREKTNNRQLTERLAFISVDPIFDLDDVRLPTAVRKSVQAPIRANVAGASTEGGYLQRLKTTADQGEAILKFCPTGQCKMVIGAAANVKTVKNGELGLYRYLHLGTHGTADPQHPEQTKLIFSRYDQSGNKIASSLTLDDIFSLKLSADLVVLSACQTGLGQDLKGEGLRSTTRAFQHAGAARVIASLWPVDENATTELMKRIYEGMFAKGLTPTASLRLAQMEMWQSPKQAEWKNPYYWGFELHGLPE